MSSIDITGQTYIANVHALNLAEDSDAHGEDSLGINISV